MDLEDLRAVSYTATQSQVLLSYRAGLFPMGVGHGGSGRMGWWAPRRRGVLFPGDLRVTKSLRTLRDCRPEDPEVKDLADKLLKTEQANIEEMKTFL